jgi:NDP-sugar pyrophosphorylase family protein
MPVGSMPIVEILIRQLARDGFNRVTICVGHHGKIIKLYFVDADLGIDIDYSEETEPLGTMGPVRALDDLPEDFLVLNGDLLTDVSFSNLFRWHCESGNHFTIGAFQREISTEFGVLEVSEDGMLTGFREKPLLSYAVSMGVYALNRRVVDLIPPGRPYGFDELVLDLLGRGMNPRIFRHHGLWLDLGRHDDFTTAQQIFDDKRESLL